MKTAILRLSLAGALALGLAFSGAATAGNGDKGCSILGTWYGVNNLEDKIPSGWVATALGKSENHGVNVLEFPTYDATFGGIYPVLYHSANRGVWRRTGGNTFEYSFMSLLAGDIPGTTEREALYYLRVSGDIVITNDCMSEEITAVMDFFPVRTINGDYTNLSPFKDAPAWSMVLDTHYSYRYTLDSVAHTFP
jgi:hypothetical protein